MAKQPKNGKFLDPSLPKAPSTLRGTDADLGSLKLEALSSPDTCPIPSALSRTRFLTIPCVWIHLHLILSFCKVQKSHCNYNGLLSSHEAQHPHSLSVKQALEGADMQWSFELSQGPASSLTKHQTGSEGADMQDVSMCYLESLHLGGVRSLILAFYSITVPKKVTVKS